MLSGKLCRQSFALYLKRVRLDSADRVNEDAWIFQTIRQVEVPTKVLCSVVATLLPTNRFPFVTAVFAGSFCMEAL